MSLTLPSNTQTIYVQGRYQYEDVPRGGTNEMLDSEHYGSSAILDGEKWKISVTNLSDTSMWSELDYDGTNTYAFNPCYPPFVSGAKTLSNGMFVTISPSPCFLPSVSDWTESFIPWLT
jgi:hypothetical protein